MRVCLDTNILVYAEGFGDSRRCDEARELIKQLADGDVVVAAQVLGELAQVLSRKAKRDPEMVREAVLSWADAYEVLDSTWHGFQAAFDLTVDHKLSLWDALILAVAAENHCRILLSEDLHSGFTWRGVTVVNPFEEPRSKLMSFL